MRIQHNISALNSYRQMGVNNNNTSSNLEKLSSGYRINKAGDDAAGLAISEKMRAQIKGLETAQKNSQDGISLVQTAEGNLTEVHSMLNRMVELATQSANGTYDNETDRTNLQKEIESLKKEIDRISESANYNGIKLLDGSLSSMQVKQTTGNGTGTALSSVQQFSIMKPFGAGETINIDGKDYSFGNGPGQITGATAEEQAANLVNAINADESDDNKIKAYVENNKIKLEAKEAGYRFAAPTIKAPDRAGTTVEGLGDGTTFTGTGTTGSASFDFSTAIGKGGNFTKGESLTINGKTFTFVTDKNDPAKNGVVIGENLEDTLTNLAAKLNDKNVSLQGTGGAGIVEGTWEYSSAQKKLNFFAKTNSDEVQVDPAITFKKPAQTGTDIVGSIAMVGEKIAAKGATATIQIPGNMSDEQIKNSSILVGGKEYAFSNLKNADGTQATTQKELASALVRKINDDPENTLSAKLDKDDGTKIVLTTDEVGSKITSVGDLKMITRADNAVSNFDITVSGAATNGKAATAANKATITFDFSKVNSADFVAGDKFSFGGADVEIKPSTNGGIAATLEATFSGEAYTITAPDGTTIAGKFAVSGDKLIWTADDVPDGTVATDGSVAQSVSQVGVVYKPKNPQPGSPTDSVQNKIKVEATDGRYQQDPVQAKVEFTVAGNGNFTAGESITINGKAMEFGNGTGQVQVGNNIAATMQNIVDKLNADENAVMMTDSDDKSAEGTWSVSADGKTLTWTQKAASDFNAQGGFSAGTTFMKEGAYQGKTVTTTEMNVPTTVGADEITITGIDGEMGSVATNKATGQTEITFNTLKKGDTFQVGDTKYQIGEAGDEVKEGYQLLEVAANEEGKFNGEDVAEALAKELRGMASADGNKVTISMQDGKYVDAKPINAGGLDLQVGETNDDYQRVTVSVGNMGTKSLGIADVDISNQDGAAAALDKIKAAINQVSSTRGDLGAIQNRLEHTINNLGVTTENMTAAESRIRDVDMAKEMMEFTKNNILVQASQAMLAQANQLPQGVLQLLR